MSVNLLHFFLSQIIATEISFGLIKKKLDKSQTLK